MTVTIGRRLEQYSLAHPDEVLLVTIDIAGTPDQVAIFKGFSSSLMGATAFDPDISVIPDDAAIQSIDRLQSPYDPHDPRYIQRDLSWAEFQPLLHPIESA
jgi:hypothetical protein